MNISGIICQIKASCLYLMAVICALTPHKVCKGYASEQGVKNAVPKTILQLMNVDGMTRENVASHLQKYRLYLKKLGGYPANAKTTPEALQQVQQVPNDYTHSHIYI